MSTLDRQPGFVHKDGAGCDLGGPACFSFMGPRFTSRAVPLAVTKRQRGEIKTVGVAGVMWDGWKPLYCGSLFVRLSRNVCLRICLCTY